MNFCLFSLFFRKTYLLCRKGVSMVNLTSVISIPLFRRMWAIFFVEGPEEYPLNTTVMLEYLEDKYRKYCSHMLPNVPFFCHGIFCNNEPPSITYDTSSVCCVESCSHSPSFHIASAN